MPAKTKRSLWGKRQCGKAEKQSQDEQNRLGPQCKDAKPLANGSCGRDSLELMNGVRFRLQEPVLSITLDKVDGDFRRHRRCRADSDAQVCQYRRRYVYTSSDNLTLRWPQKSCEAAAAATGGICSVSDNKLNGAIPSVRAGPAMMRGFLK